MQCVKAPAALRELSRAFQSNKSLEAYALETRPPQVDHFRGTLECSVTDCKGYTWSGGEACEGKSHQFCPGCLWGSSVEDMAFQLGLEAEEEFIRCKDEDGLLGKRKDGR